MSTPWKLLLIDDNPDDRVEWRRMLLQGSPRRFRFTEAETGLGGIRACKYEVDRPDCILLDFHLPDMDAVEVLAELKGNNESVPYPVVVVTGSSEPGLGHEVLKAGAQDFIGKSWSTPQSLARAVENAVDRFSLLAEGRIAQERLRTLQQELASTNVQLEKTVNERTLKLREAMEELEFMSYSMIHDMRAPLRAMHGFATMLEDEWAGLPRATGLDYSRRIRKAAARLDGLITDALNYNQVVREDLPPEPVDLGRLLHGMLDTYPDLRPSAADIQIEFVNLMVEGNESLLTQCFGNLLTNAVKFVPRGVKPVVRVSAENHAETVRIWVSDNGIGIPLESRGRIFEMFQRLHHEREYPGTGIGLAIVRKAVQRLKGTVGVESKLGGGSRFWIVLRQWHPKP